MRAATILKVEFEINPNSIFELESKISDTVRISSNRFKAIMIIECYLFNITIPNSD